MQIPMLGSRQPGGEGEAKQVRQQKAVLRYNLRIQTTFALSTSSHPRRTVDFTSPYVHMLQVYAGYSSVTDGTQLMQPTAEASLQVLPPICYAHQPVSSCTTNFVGVGHGKVGTLTTHQRSSTASTPTQPVKGSVNVVVWLPDGRRCLSGSQAGDFSYWNGTHFFWETQIQARIVWWLLC